jgi:hypothetical protein
LKWTELFGTSIESFEGSEEQYMVELLQQQQQDRDDSDLEEIAEILDKRSPLGKFIRFFLDY